MRPIPTTTNNTNSPNTSGRQKLCIHQKAVNWTMAGIVGQAVFCALAGHRKWSAFFFFSRAAWQLLVCFGRFAGLLEYEDETRDRERAEALTQSTTLLGRAEKQGTEVTSGLKC